MAPTAPRLRILSVGGNAVSAFLSWRLQATNACDVTLVWKSGFDAVYQYGISFKSTTFGNERFKPRHVVRTPEDATNNKNGPFDYVVLCVKALPDIYDLAAVIESVVTPDHTCIIVNTTHALGVESHLEQRFPKNVVLSLVSGVEITQLSASEFEHKAVTEIWVGPANRNPTIPVVMQQDMAETLAMTLRIGQVDCKVSPNIRQQQYERMIGPIAFHPVSVLLETPSHAALLEKVGVRTLVSGIIDELLEIAQTQGCKFQADFRQKTIEEMTRPTESNSIMYQDYAARRPMEVETYLGSPIKLAQVSNVRVPRIETLYALLHHLNIVNQQRPKDGPMPSPINGAPSYMPRLSSVPSPRLPMNGPNGGPPGRGRARTPSVTSVGGPPPGVPGPRRGPPSINGGPNGYGRPPGNGYGPPPRSYGQQQSRRGSLDGNDLEEFSHLVLYDDIPEAGEATSYGGDGSDLALRERELMLKQREIALREQELRMKRGTGPRRAPPSIQNGGFDDDDDDDYFDPSAGPSRPMIDPDNFDMMSVTSRRNRKVPNARDIRKNPEFDGNMRKNNGGFPRNAFNNKRGSSTRLINDLPEDNGSIMDDPLMGYSSNRYGTVDRQQLGRESRTNSLTTSRLDDMQYNTGPGGYPRRASQSPGIPYINPQMGRGNGRPSPPNGYIGNGNGRPSPPGGVRQPVPRYPPGQGNMVAPQQVEQHAGVSALHPSKGLMNNRSLTGSASASAASGDSAASLHIDSENSAHSSQSSLGPRPPIGVR